MMNKMCMAAVIAASLYAGTPFAQPAAVKKIIETGQTDNRVMHQLDILTNRFGGRVIGSDAYENAAEWMMREYILGSGSAKESPAPRACSRVMSPARSIGRPFLIF